MSSSSEEHPEVRVHGNDPLPGRAAGRAILFTGVGDWAAVLWMTVFAGLVTWMGFALILGEVAEKVFLALASLGWLYLLQRLLSPFKVLVGLDHVTEWRWNGRRSLPLHEAVSTARGRRHCSLVARRSTALSKGLHRAQLAAIEWLFETRDGLDHREKEDVRALDERAGPAPMVILAVGETVVPILDDDVWLAWRTAGGTDWRLAAERLRAAAEGASIVLVPRTWDAKHLFFGYSDEALLLAEPSSDVESIRERLGAR